MGRWHLVEEVIESGWRGHSAGVVSTRKDSRAQLGLQKRKEAPVDRLKSHAGIGEERMADVFWELVEKSREEAREDERQYLGEDGRGRRGRFAESLTCVFSPHPKPLTCVFSPHPKDLSTSCPAAFLPLPRFYLLTRRGHRYTGHLTLCSSKPWPFLLDRQGTDAGWGEWLWVAPLPPLNPAHSLLIPFHITASATFHLKERKKKRDISTSWIVFKKKKPH